MSEFDKEENNFFSAEHFEGQGDKWAAIAGDTDQIIAYCISTTAKEGNAIAGAKVLIDGTEQGVALMQYPENAAISAGLLMLAEPQGKAWDIISVFPMLEGQPSRLTIIDTFAWESKIEGEISAFNAEGVGVDFFNPCFFKEQAVLKPDTEHVISLAALAFQIEPAQERSFEMDSGAYYEVALQTFLKDNPDKTKDDFKSVTISMGGARIFLPAQYVCEYEFQCPVLSVEEIDFVGIRFHRMLVEFAGNEEPLKGFLYASETVLNGYVPKTGDDVCGVLWMAGHMVNF